MQIQAQYQFTYLMEGKVEYLIVPVIDGFSPLLPLIKLLGLNAARVYDQMRATPYELVKYSGYSKYPMFSQKPEQIDQWLHSIKRNKNPELLKHIQAHYVQGLRALIKDVQTPVGERQEVQAVYEPTYISDEQEAREGLACYDTIYIDDKPLDNQQFARLLMNQLGVSNWDDLNYMAVTCEYIMLHRLPREGSKEPYETWKLYIWAIPRRTIFKDLLAGGWDVAPVFFMKYPELYERKTMQTIEFDFGAKKRVVKTNGLNFATWFEERYAKKIYELLQIKQKIQEQEREQALEKLRQEIRKQSADERIQFWLDYNNSTESI